MAAPTSWRKYRLAWALLLLAILLPLVDLWRWWIWRTRHTHPRYALRDWSAPYEGGIDLSGYLFRDRNRDGRLDLGDRPMAGVAIEMTAPDGRHTVIASNITGFANFSMSRAKRSAVIREPGVYRFRVLVPPGWRVTANEVQDITVVSLAGAPGDLVALRPPQPTGLVPDLVIAGRVVPAGEQNMAAHPQLRAVGPDGRGVDVPLDASGGGFRITAAPGPWRLTATVAGQPARERSFEVRDAPITLAAFDFTRPDGGDAERTPFTIDFESVTGIHIAKIPSGVAGLDWNMLNAIEVIAGETEGYVNTVTSGHYVGYASSGHPVTISRPGGFDFYGGYFGASTLEAEGETLRFQAYQGATLVAEDTLALSALGPRWFEARYRAIDRLVLSSRHDWQFVMDDLKVGGFAPGAATGQ